MAQPQSEVYDFAVDGAASSISFTPPAKTWMVEIVARDVVTVGSETLEVGVGGLSTSTYPRHYHTVTVDATDVISGAGAGARLGTTGHATRTAIYGLQLAAPTVYLARPMDIGMAGGVMQISAGYQQAATAHSTVEIRTSGATNMTAGKVWAIYHIRKNQVLETVDFGSAAAVSHAFTSLGKSNSMVLVAPSLGLSGADEIELHLSADGGSSWDTGASDYNRGQANRDFGTDGGLVDYFMHTEFSGTAGSFLAVMENFNIAAPSTLIYGASVAAGNAAPRHMSSFRDNIVKHDGLRMITGGGVQTMNAGIAYLYGAK